MSRRIPLLLLFSLVALLVACFVAPLPALRADDSGPESTVEQDVASPVEEDVTDSADNTIAVAGTVTQCVQAWLTNEKVDTIAAAPDHPAVAVDAAGNAYVLWKDNASGHDDIMFRSRLPSGVWGQAIPVNNSDSGTRNYAALAVDAAGNAYALWQDTRNGHADIFFSYRPLTGTWSANFPVNTAFTGTRSFPSIAVDSDGNAYAVWMDARNGHDQIYFSYRPVTGTWGIEAPVSDSAASDSTLPSIAVDALGRAYVAWIDYRDGPEAIYFSRRSRGGIWQANVRVNDPGSTAQSGPAIAVDPSGNAYAVWADPRNGNDDIYSSFRPASGPWQPNVLVNDDTAGARQSWPAVAVDGSGNAYAAWQDQRGDSGDIYFSYRTRSSAWRPNAKVNDDVGAVTQSSAAIAAGAYGSVWAAWLDQRDSPGGNVYSSELPPYALRINAGGPEYNSSLAWCADAAFSKGAWGFLGGKAVANSAPIANTSDPVLYQSDHRWDTTASPGYRMAVPNGDYWVTLKFAETNCAAANCRVFSVSIEGSTVLSNFDIYASAGANRAIDKKYLVKVSDGDIKIAFTAVTGKPKINAIEVRRVFTQRINAGGGAYTDVAGNAWQADRIFSAGLWGYLGNNTVALTTPHAIGGTTDGYLYQTERRKMSGYAFTVPNGSYKVTLKFSENSTAIGAGQRRFDVQLEGVTVWANFDIFVAAGNRQFYAVDRTRTVTVSDGVLNVGFIPLANNAQIDAIAIIQK